MTARPIQLPRPDLAGRVLRAVGQVELVVSVAAFLATCAVVSANALLRFAFNSSLVWSEEVALLATNVFVFIGAAVIMKARADIAVSLVLEALPARPRRLVQLATLVAAAVFFACLLAASISLWPLQRNSTTFILDINRYGVDPVHFGVIICLNLIIGIITPPMGIGLFAAAGVTKLPVETVTRATLPYLLPLLLALALITYVPALTLWLPDLVMGPALPRR